MKAIRNHLKYTPAESRNETALNVDARFTGPSHWTGAVDTDWFKTGNWSDGVPTATIIGDHTSSADHSTTR